MDRNNEQTDIDVIELGVASVETKGLPNGSFDEEGKRSIMGGLSDD